MKYYSEEELSDIIGVGDMANIRLQCHPINVRLCRDCEYFEREHPTIDTDGDFGYCAYKTDFYVLDDEPINWYFTDINGFCREDDIDD